MWLLYRLGHHQGLVHAIENAIIRKGISAPSQLQDIQRFVETPLTFPIVNVVGFIGADKSTASYAKIQSTIAQLIDRCGLFCNSQGIVQG